MVTQEIIKGIEGLNGVSAVREHAASGRHYINLITDGGNAARNTKAFIKGDTLTLDFGKGSYSDKFRDAVADLEAFCAQHGTVSRLYAGAPSFTAKF